MAKAKAVRKDKIDYVVKETFKTSNEDERQKAFLERFVNMVKKSVK